MDKNIEALLAPLTSQQREAVLAAARLSPSLILPKARRDAITAFPLRRKREKTEADTGVTPEREGRPIGTNHTFVA